MLYRHLTMIHMMLIFYMPSGIHSWHLGTVRIKFIYGRIILTNQSTRLQSLLNKLSLWKPKADLIFNVLKFFIKKNVLTFMVTMAMAVIWKMSNLKYTSTYPKDHSCEASLQSDLNTKKASYKKKLFPVICISKITRIFCYSLKSDDKSHLLFLSSLWITTIFYFHILVQ